MSTETQHFWHCRNCGHEEPISDSLTELGFAWIGPPRTSTVACPNCRSRTFQQAFDDACTAGYFLVIRTKNGIKGKG